MPSYLLNSIKPVVEEGAYVHPTAVLIGDVIVKKGCFIAPYAVMRGDFGRLILEEGANLQEHCCMHSFPDADAIIERGGHIGHGAILHGCTVKKNAMVGMNSVVMDKAIIGENSIVGANSLVKAGLVIPPNSLVVGSPSKIVRTLTDDEIRWKTEGTYEYQRLVDIYQQTLKEVEPDIVIHEQRARMTLSTYKTKDSQLNTSEIDSH